MSAVSDLGDLIWKVTSMAPADAEGPAVVDVHFFKCAVHEHFDRARFRDLLRAALGEGEFGVVIDEDRARQGPSYIEWGAWIGSQDLALRMFACGEVAGLWQVITPKRLGIEGPQAADMAGAGYVMSGPPDWDAPERSVT